MTETLGQGPDGSDPRPSRTVTLDLSALPRAGTAVGIALAGAAISVSMVFSRHGPLDGSVFSVGAVASLLLIAIAVVSSTRGEQAADLVSWPGAAGAIGVGLMLAVLVNDDGSSAYAGGGVTLALGVLGYLAARSAPFVITVLGALAVLYIQAVSDLTPGGDPEVFAGSSDSGDNNHFMVIAAAIAVFVIAVTLAGWLLPRTRVLSGVLVGIGGLVTLAFVMQALMLARILSAYSSDLGGPISDDDFEDPGAHVFDSATAFFAHNPFRNDIYVVLSVAVLLAAFWTCVSLATGHVAFRLLVIADAVAMIPMVMLGLVATHATWWAAGLGVIGIGALAFTAYRARATGAPPVVPPEPGPPGVSSP